MFKYLLLSLLIGLEINVIAQKKLTYEGPFQNGLPAKATARYAYYVDQSGKKIKDGSFRYLVKEKDHDYRFIQNFQGNYSNGLKDGEWEYEIKSKDYPNKNDEFFTSAEISLIAFYSMGYPEGRWSFSALIYKRKKQPNGEWDKQILVKDVKMLLNFKKGVLIDSIQIYDSQGANIDVLCDRAGFIFGDFVLKSKKISINYKYQDGFLAFKNNKVFSDYIYYQANTSMKEKDFVVDTISYFAEKYCMITKYLNSNVFNGDYFLFNYIDGDLMFDRNSRGLITGIQYKGLYVKEMRVALTPWEQKAIKDIWYYSSKVESMKKIAINELKKDSKNKALKNRVGALTNISSEIKSYICVANHCKNIVEINKLLEASKGCGNLSFLDQKINTKKELLQIILKASRAAYLKADKLTK